MATTTKNPVAYRVNDDTLAYVAALAAHLDISKTAVIEQAIAHFAAERLPVRVDIGRSPAVQA